jgi:hypothetical protein
MTNDDQSNWAGGYRQPPYDHRFKPGNSGNPRGRPRKAPRVTAVGDVGMQFLSKPTPVMIGGKKQKMSAIDALIISGFNAALKSGKSIDLTRFLDKLAKLGFNYIAVEASAREQERALFDQELALQEQTIKACHDEIKRLDRIIAAQSAALAQQQKPAD